jgi:hypothetical protein
MKWLMAVIMRKWRSNKRLAAGGERCNNVNAGGVASAWRWRNGNVWRRNGGVSAGASAAPASAAGVAQRNVLIEIKSMTGK